MTVQQLIEDYQRRISTLATLKVVNKDKPDTIKKLEIKESAYRKFISELKKIK